MAGRRERRWKPGTRCRTVESVRLAAERQAGSRPREEDADAIYQKLARTLQDKAAQHVAPIACCGGRSTAASTAPLAYKWARILVSRRQHIAAKKGAPL